MRGHGASQAKRAARNVVGPTLAEIQAMREREEAERAAR